MILGQLIVLANIKLGISEQGVHSCSTQFNFKLYISNRVDSFSAVKVQEYVKAITRTRI